MIDTNELRRKVNSTDIVDHIDLHANIKPFLSELLDRLEAAEKERDTLRDKITEMEQQEPIAWLYDDGRFVWRETAPYEINYADCKMALYALPGAQPAPSVPEVTDAMIEAIESRAEQSYRRHHGGARGQQIVPADALSWHIIHATRKVLSEATEAKP